MSAPLSGAGYLRPPKRLGTKEEVLKMLREHVMSGMKGMMEETREQRMERKLIDLHEAVVWRRNTVAGPHFVAIGPIKPSREDERFKLYRTRFGMVSND
ncbi:TPA: hypothetical protein ACJ2WV_001821 [Kluyvera georgiana]